jgi:type IV secretory pathway VirB2 component (pilin)
MKIGFVIFSILYANFSWSRSLKATADKLAQETTRIGFGLAIFGIVLAAIYFMLGKQDASTKMTQALMGVFVLMLAPTIVNFVRGLA